MISPLRQQTLRNAISWSYDLLTPDEQQLFQRLSVFRGGWTLEAADAVTGDSAGAVLDWLERLAEHSLVRVREQPDGEVRYSMLETIREYGLERLSQDGLEEQTHVRHGRYFLGLAESSVSEWRSHADEQWSAQLRTELDNLRVALNWFMEHDGEAFSRLSGALWRFYGLYGSVNEGRDWLEMALRQPQPVHPEVRARVLEGIGTLAYIRSDYVSAQTACDEALAIWQSLGEKSGIALTLHLLGRLAFETGDYPQAERYYTQSLDIYRQLADSSGIADMLNVLGVIASDVAGEYDRAQALFEESLELRRKVGDLFGISQSLTNLGDIALETGDYLRARSLFEESQALGQRHSLTSNVGAELLSLGLLALRQGEDTQAMMLLGRSIRTLQEEGDPKWVARCLIPLAELAARRQQPTRTAHIGGAIEALANRAGYRLPPQEQIAYDRVITAARAQVDAGEWAAAWDRGQAMSLDEAVDYALSAHLPVSR
ncbi:hypothetical protein BH24CHL1_BH24CHL1_12420 [soil metagenome]